ncbi:MAG: DUF3467 domain-containing protein [Cohaesibacter sp.]|jgi:hypothetical protein|nr:DUF3467 domain-containing protein [Cohaesibacter sp.]
MDENLNSHEELQPQPESDAAASGAATTKEAVPTKVTWDDSEMETTFANVVNVLSTREEFAVLFGTNQTWNVVGSKELSVKLANRIVLTPYAAKRLQALLAARIAEYEKQFGELKL